MKYMNEYDYCGKRVRIRFSQKPTYRNKGLIGLYGTVNKLLHGQLSVKIDGRYNDSSFNGMFWFKLSEVNFVDEEENENMKKLSGYNFIAIVNLLEDCGRNDYGFALYDTECSVNAGDLVVVNPRNEERRAIGEVKNIVTAAEYGKDVTSQVVGTINMNGYKARLEKAKKVDELQKAKKRLEDELDKEINKRKSIEYYEEMVDKYSDNKGLKTMLENLKNLTKALEEM